MLIRITGGKSGIAQYLEHGQKQNRTLTRDALDERQILTGDLEVTDNVISSIENNGDKYLHITISFKEDTIPREVLNAIALDFRNFALSAYGDDEFNFYAEAHIPKIKSYSHERTGQLVERKPHIHIVIPQTNLLSGKHLNPFGKGDNQIAFLEAFQEYTNAKYGLASPKDNRRTTFTPESELLSRYIGDLLDGPSRAIKESILSEVLDKNISSYTEFMTMLQERGETKTRNPGKANEYPNLKPPGAAKGINLKDYVFTREFIELPGAQKRQALSADAASKYERQQAARTSAPELARRLTEWHAIRAPELKYINSGNRKLYAAYRSASVDEKRAILTERAQRFYAKHRVGPVYGANQNPPFNPQEQRNERPDYDRANPADTARDQRAAALHQSDLGQARSQAPPQSIASLRNLSSIGMVHHERPAQVLLHAHAPDRVGPKRSTHPELRRAGVGLVGTDAPPGVAKPWGDSVIGQHGADIQADLEQRAAQASPAITQLRLELDARLLLDHLASTHGVIQQKYEVVKGADGGDRIRAGARNLNVADFLTKELHLTWAEAEPVMRQAQALQQAREPAPERQAQQGALWREYRTASAAQRPRQRREAWITQRTSEAERRAAIKAEFTRARQRVNADPTTRRADKKAQMSLARMARVQAEQALRVTQRAERVTLREQLSRPDADQYRDWLAARAQAGDDVALKELRRQRGNVRNDPTNDQTHGQTAQGSIRPGASEDGKGAKLASALLAYTVARNGDVTYHDSSGRALIQDTSLEVRMLQADSATIETGLRLAVQKYGQTLELTGSAEFQRRAVEVAVSARMRVDFTDAALNSYKTQLLESQRSPSSRMDRGPER